MKSSRRASRSSRPALLATGLSLGLGVATLLGPQTALADEPPPAPSAAPAPSADPAPSATPAPSADPAPPAEPPPPPRKLRPLPPSVLRMKGQDVVLRLDGGSEVEGNLISVDDEVFELRSAAGKTVRIPRQHVRGVRLAGTPDPARATKAETHPSEDSSPPEVAFGGKERSFGFGTAFGGGFSGAGGGMTGAFLLPTAELQIFLPSEYSIDVTVPVLNIALSSALLGGLVVGSDLYFNVNAGKGKARLVAGPGIGFAYAEVGSVSVTAIKVPAQLGFEVLSKKRTFGFKMVARPWLEFGVGGSSRGLGGGLLGALVFSGYGLSDRPVE